MIQKMRKIACLGLAALALIAGTLIITTQPALAQREDVCEGVELAGGSCSGGDNEISQLVQTAINILSLIGGIAAILVIIISGLRLITSAGNPEGLKDARNGIIYAILGIVIIAFAQIIVRFVLGRLGAP